MVMLDSIEFYDVFLGALRIGAVPAPVNPLLPARDLGADRRRQPGHDARRLRRASRRGGRHPGRRTRRVARSSPPARRSGTSSSPTASDGAPWASWDESPGFWLCTSGSTGRPKLAMHRHIDLRVTADTYGAQVLGVQPDDRCYSVGPMFHAYGLGNSLTFPFSVGATAIVEPTRPPTPALVGEIARIAAADAAVLHPDVLRRAVRVRPPGRHVRLGAVGSLGGRAAAGGHVPPLRRALRRAHPRRHRLDRDDAHLHLQHPDGTAPGHVGPAGARLSGRRRGRRRAAGPGRRRRAPRGQRRLDGRRLLVRLGGVSAQLPRRPHAHRRHVLVLGRRLLHLPRPQRRHACASAASGSRRPRSKPCSSPNPAVLEAAVVGYRDEQGVQRPAAYVVATPGQTVDVAELEAICKAELAGYKRPKRYEVVAELPKTATGKIRRYALRDQLAASR